MTPKALYSGARQAIRFARECERSSLDYDAAWHEYMRRESARHRERAADYLKSRTSLLQQFEMPLERAA